MKFRFFDVERFGIWNNAKLDNLQNGLTVIHGPNGSGKTTLMQFVRAVLFGRPQAGSQRYLPAVHPGSQGGRLGVSQADREFIMNRFWENDHGSDDATITRPDGSVHDSLAFRELLGEVGPEIYMSLFSVGYREAEDFGLVVREALADGESTLVASDELARVQRALIDIENATDRLDELQRERDRLRAEISRLSAERVTPPTELVQVREAIGKLEVAIRELQQRLRELELAIANAEQDNVTAESGAAINSAGERLEKLDRQIANWRNWQHEIEEQLAAIRHQLHHTALRDCDPVERSPQTQMFLARGNMTAIENQIADIHSQLNRVRTPGSTGVETGLNDLRNRVFELCNQLGQHEVLDEIAAMDAEAVQLRRCQMEADRQLSLMLQRRRILLHQFSNGAPEAFRQYAHREQATCQSFAHHEWLQQPTEAAPQVNHRLQELATERDELLRQLQNHQRELAELTQRLSVLERQLDNSDIARRLEALRLDLNIVEEEIREEQEQKDVRTTTRAMLLQLKEDYESRRKSVVLAEASDFLQRLRGDKVELVPDADHRSIQIQHVHGELKSLDALSRGERDQVALSLRLALTRAYTRRGTRLPLILDDVFVTSDSESARATAILLRDFADDNQQILFFTCHEHIARMFENLGVTVRQLPNNKRSTPVPEQRQPRPIVSKVIAEPRPPIQPTPVVTAPWVGAPRQDDSLVVKAFRSERDELTDRKPTQFEPTANWIFYTELSTHISKLTGLTDEQVEELESSGVSTVEDLLALVPDAAAIQLSHIGLTPEQLRFWQSQALLACRVPMLRRVDAELLVLCGITTPEQLADLHPNDVFERVNAYLRTSDGKQFVSKSNPFDRQTAINWVRWAAHARTLWHSRERSKQSTPTTPSRFVATTPGRDQDEHDFVARSFISSGNGNGSGSGNGNGNGSESGGNGNGSSRQSRRRSRSTQATSRSSSRTTRSTRTRDASRPKKRKTRTATATATRTRTTKRSERTERAAREQNTDRALRFYLNREAPVEDAPSIGPRTAEHLAKVSIVTVLDLLNADPDSAAQNLNHRRIKANTIREWQAQATLVCRIPELRGHDAQILVACDVTTPEQLAAFRPADLFARVAPFVDTSEGERIIRNGKKPDLDEITFWIDCAAQSRTLRAA